MARRCQLKVGDKLSRENGRLTFTAGSALIQACEKAGAVIPRYVQPDEN